MADTAGFEPYQYQHVRESLYPVRVIRNTRRESLKSSTERPSRTSDRLSDIEPDLFCLTAGYFQSPLARYKAPQTQYTSSTGGNMPSRLNYFNIPTDSFATEAEAVKYLPAFKDLVETIQITSVPLLDTWVKNKKEQDAASASPRNERSAKRQCVEGWSLIKGLSVFFCRNNTIIYKIFSDYLLNALISHVQIK